MNTLFASFEPTEDVVFLLTSLRQAGLAWIADEVESVIRNGYSVVRQSQTTHSKNNGHNVMPFDADEQLRITIRAILSMPMIQWLRLVFGEARQKLWHSPSAPMKSGIV